MKEETKYILKQGKFYINLSRSWNPATQREGRELMFSTSENAYLFSSTTDSKFKQARAAFPKAKLYTITIKEEKK